MAGNRVAVVGVGYSTTGRNTGLTSRQLALQAGLAALDDAGMTPADVDGVSMCWSVAGPSPEGIDPINAQDVAHMLGVDPLNFDFSGGTVFMSSARDAMMAVQSGQCHTAIAFRVINQRLSVSNLMGTKTQEGPTRVSDDELRATMSTGGLQWGQPFGQILPVQAMGALVAQRYLDIYGATDEDFYAHVENQRYHATLNPEAIFREPITREAYFGSRFISKPLRLFDCDYPVDSGSAVIFTTEERARDWRKKPVFVEASASCVAWRGQPGNANFGEDMWNSPPATADLLWSRTGLQAGDVDTVQLYDGFSIIPLLWLEAFGFCKPGEAGDYIRAGEARLGGTRPMNTDGGMCNAGRRHGANQCIESVRQLRGECGERQVPGAEVALWTNGFWWAALMTAN
jgi:acetyl-CoA acetyltransferase